MHNFTILSSFCLSYEHNKKAILTFLLLELQR